jgi:hypothetical protein
VYPDTAKRLKHPRVVLEAREEYIQACLDKTDCKEASVIWDLMYRPTLAEKRLFPFELTEWLKLLEDGR